MSVQISQLETQLRQQQQQYHERLEVMAQAVRQMHAVLQVVLAGNPLHVNPDEVCVKEGRHSSNLTYSPCQTWAQRWYQVYGVL